MTTPTTQGTRCSPVPGMPGLFTAPSQSNPNTLYRIQVSADGEVAVCTCPGYERHGGCLHVKEILGRPEVAGLREPAKVTTRDMVVADTQLPALPVELPTKLLPGLDEIRAMQELGHALSGAVGYAIPSSLKNPDQAFAIMLAGWEMGIRPMTAFRHVFVVNGRTEPDAQLMMGIVAANDRTAEFRFSERSSTRCAGELWRHGKLVVAGEYTIEDAQHAHLIKADNPWAKFPRDMCAWALVKRLCRLGASDLINAVSAFGEGEIPESLFEPVVEPPERPIPVSLAGPAPATMSAAPVFPDNVDPKTGEFVWGDTEPAPEEARPDEPGVLVDAILADFKAEPGSVRADMAAFLGGGTTIQVAEKALEWLDAAPGRTMTDLARRAAKFREDPSGALTPPTERA